MTQAKLFRKKIARPWKGNTREAMGTQASTVYRRPLPARHTSYPPVPYRVPSIYDDGHAGSVDAAPSAADAAPSASFDHSSLARPRRKWVFQLAPPGERVLSKPDLDMYLTSYLGVGSSGCAFKLEERASVGALKVFLAFAKLVDTLWPIMAAGDAEGRSRQFMEALELFVRQGYERRAEEYRSHMTFLEAVGAAALPSLCAVTSVEKVLVQFSSIQDHLLQNCFPESTSGDEGLVVITMKVWEVVKGKRMVVPALRYPYVGPDLLTLLTDPRFPFQCNCTRMVWLFGDLFLCMDRLQSKQKFIAHLDIKLENLGVVLEDGGKPAALKLLDLETAGQILPDYTGGVPALLGQFIYDTNRRDLETAFPTYGGDVMLSDLGMMYHVIVPEFGMYRSMTSALVDMQMRFDAARSVVQVEDVHACLASWLQAFRRHRSTVDAGNTIPAAVHTFLTQMILGPAIPEDDRPPQWTDLQWTFYMET